ncbi:MAG: M14 family zinc carboxypeptidase [Planctomycetota bacterium]
MIRGAPTAGRAALGAGLLALLAARTAGQAPPPIDRPLSIEEIEAAAAGLVARHPDWIRLETVGVSRSGRSIVAIVLTDAALVPAGAKPGLAVVDHLGGPDSRGAEIALALAEDLAARRGSDPEADRLLSDVAFYLLPALDPDARAVGEEAGALPPRPVRFGRNFPLGWLPAALVPGAGDTPLSEPETLATARFLAARPDLVALVDALPLSPDLRPGTAEPPGIPAADLELHRSLAGVVGPAPWFAGERGGGSLVEYAYRAQGVFAFTLFLPRPLAPGPAFAEEVALRVAEVESLAASLPRVTLVEEALAPLGSGLWQLDVRLANAGRLPTRSALRRERSPGGGIRLGLEGARLVATAVQEGEAGAYRVLAAAPGAADTIAAGDLDGGAARGLRLVLQAEPGAEIALVGRSAAAGTARLQRILP